MIFDPDQFSRQIFWWLYSLFLLVVIVINSLWAQDATPWHGTYSSVETLRVNSSSLCRCWLQGHCCRALYLALVQLWAMWVPAMCPLSGGQAVECRGHKHFKSYKTFIKFSRYLASVWPFLILVLFFFFVFSHWTASEKEDGVKVTGEQVPSLWHAGFFKLSRPLDSY